MRVKATETARENSGIARFASGFGSPLQTKNGTSIAAWRTRATYACENATRISPLEHPYPRIAPVAPWTRPRLAENPRSVTTLEGVKSAGPFTYEDPAATIAETPMPSERPTNVVSKRPRYPFR